MSYVQGARRKRRRIAYRDYTVAILVPMSVELTPMRAMLDEIHDDLPTKTYQNAYVLGRLGHHNVVIAILPRTGTSDSAAVATQLKEDFPAIHFAFLVGIAGGIPGANGTNDIRLGDVVVSEPTGTLGGVIQFDRGKHHSGKKFEITGHLNNPPQILLAALQKARAEHTRTGNHLQQHITEMLRDHPTLATDYQRPNTATDVLFMSDYEHSEGVDCAGCDPSRKHHRPRRPEDEIKIHYGTIGSSNAVVKDAIERDRLRDEYGILSVEMEAAGLMNIVPCLVIRGICDYADSHKNKVWQPFAAAAASAYAKELLHFVAPLTIKRALRGSQIVPTMNQEDQSTPTLRSLCRSLAFDRMDARLRNISAALSRTCDWLYQNSQFIDWNDADKQEAHHGFLWIKGKPGCGKSTMMKTLWTHTRKQKHNVVISYFFNARATGQLEKSTFGLYRSLALQLVQMLPELDHLFLEHFAAKERSGEVEEWTAGELQDFIRSGILEPRDRPLVVFIDALDEGENDNDVRHMVTFLQELATAAMLVNSSLKICLSSRHYPHITIRKGLSLVMEEQKQHMQDIRTYVQTVLVGEQEAATQEIRERVCAKSAGVFMWVNLVVGLLNKAYDRGQVKEMSQVLDELPPDLDGVYRTILKVDVAEKEQCAKLLRWVSYSQRPLSRVELYVAMQDSSALAEFSDESIPSDSVLDRYFLDTSRGLIELSESEPRVVQFIHETVRTFLTRFGSEFLSPQTTSEAQKHEGECHEDLKRSCMECVQYCSQQASNDPSERPGPLRRTTTRMPGGAFSFAEYAVNNLFKHSDDALKHDVPQVEFIKQFIPLSDNQQCIMSRWIKLRNAFENFRAREYSQGTPSPLLYILAEKNCPVLIGLLLEMHVRDVMTNQRYGTALQVACKVGHNDVVRTLLRHGSDKNAEGGECKHPLLAAILHQNQTAIELLLHSNARPSKEALEWALFICLARLNLVGVTTILRFGLDVNSLRNRRGESALAFALSKSCNMIDKNTYFPIEDQIYLTYSENPALMPVPKKSFGTCLDIMRLLIEHGADVNDFSGGEVSRFPEEFPLQYALRRRNLSAARLLVEHGADVNAKTSEGVRLWSDMIRSRSKAGISFLRYYHAEFDKSDLLHLISVPKPWQYNSITAMLYYTNLIKTGRCVGWWFDHGYEPPPEDGKYSDTHITEITSKLLELGSEMKAEDEFRTAALRFAALHGGVDAVVSLLEEGKSADCMARDANNDRALDLALRARERVVQGDRFLSYLLPGLNLTIGILRQAMEKYELRGA